MRSPHPFLRPAPLLLAAILLPGTAEATGPRLVSINPCIDAILMEVADPSQLAGISHYSQDPQASSIPLALARRFHATSGTAEEVVALRPDLVLAGAHVAPATIQALRRMNVRLVQFEVAGSVAESEQQVRDIAGAAGHPERGAVLVRRIEAALAAAAVPRDSAPVPALIRQSGGLVPGQGTLADELLRRTGFSNLSAGYGLKMWDVLPLEYLVARPPRVLFSVTAGSDRLATHPALARLATHVTVAPFPARLLNCGGPTIVGAAARLAQVRRAVAW